jgi:hypothetical protein
MLKRLQGRLAEGRLKSCNVVNKAFGLEIPQPEERRPESAVKVSKAT